MMVCECGRREVAGGGWKTAVQQVTAENEGYERHFLYGTTTRSMARTIDFAAAAAAREPLTGQAHTYLRMYGTMVVVNRW